MFRLFCVLLTVHLGTMLVNNQLGAQFFSAYVYFDTVTYNRCRIDTIDSPDDEHKVARNM